MFLVLAATAFVLQPNGAQAASRLALTAAVAEQGTVVIDDYEETLGADRAVRDGHVYSDKAPGQPIAGVPLWWLYRAVGGEEGTELRVDGNLGLWWQTLWFSAFPAAVLVVLLFRSGRAQAGSSNRTAALSAVALFGGSILLPFTTELFGHVLAACLGFGSFVVLRGRNGESSGLVVAGILAGGAVLVEYTTVMVVAVLTVAAMILNGRDSWKFLAGGAIPAVALATYHSIAFGGPLEHAYKYSVFEFHQNSVGGIGVPDAGTLAAVLVGPRGLFTLTPVVAVSLAGLIAARRRLQKVDFLVPAAILAVYLLFASGWLDATGGASPGPRHLIPALPFLIFGMNEALTRWRTLSVAVSAVSVSGMVLATVGDPLLPSDVEPAIAEWWTRIAAGDGARTVFEPVLGHGGWIVVMLLTAAAILHLWKMVGDQPSSTSRASDSFTPDETPVRP